ncbi:type VI secretion system protein ImpG [Noviherbaspirillum humi]|uniref:Type VI secretion system protein ImpG n=1 Tax=Noviherbaspirillum humi TaxID=1688639 RepID=A0A239DJT8_9BURK|nr:type VI secretion system baseplate subunit TssF [Noviherbaspirillum humi]SNS32677.1 type VI secretion system protein ImpG [Noviherbaspirillum humi]
MLDELLPYYERELAFLRELSGEFARRYPKVARRLALDGEQSDDPHVERMMEAFAFLAARIHRKLDAEFPEIAEGFMQVLYPHYLQPFPACTILQFDTGGDKPGMTGRHTIPRHQPVTSPAVGGISCQFRTCYPVDLFPLEVSAVGLRVAQESPALRASAPDAAAVLTLRLQAQGGLPLAGMGLDRLRFFLDGDPAQMHLLRDLLLRHALRVQAGDGSGRLIQAVGGAPELKAVGFAEEDRLLDGDERSFTGHHLLREYFAFPDKFLFLDIQGLQRLPLEALQGTLEIGILLSPLPENERHQRLLRSLHPGNFKLGCTPAINLFRRAAEPIRLTHRRSSYPVQVDSRRPLAYEVIAITAVRSAERQGSQDAAHEVLPFYSLRHGAADGARHAYWHASREASVREHDRGTELEICFVDLDFQPRRPAAEVLSLDLLCSNRDLPASLAFGGDGPCTDFTLPQATVVKRVRLLRKPTVSLRPPAKQGLAWRLISHLSLNHAAFAAGSQALQELLSLYDFGQSAAAARQIGGIVAVDSAPAVVRVAGPHFSGFARGTDFTVTLDEAAFVGTGPLLFGSVLEHYLALCCGPNSFTRLTLLSHDQKQVIARWPARNANTIVT